MNAIGIDLGTTNSVACIVRNGKLEFLKFSGKDLLPSAILVNNEKIIVGKAALNRSIISADKFISSAKTYMGDPSHVWEIDGRKFTATDVAAEVLKEIYKAARKFFANDEEITAVITVPAQFSFNQRAETKKAGEIAGFNVKQILTEPVSAAIAYAADTEKNEKIYVVDLGGGTFDVALLESQGGNYYKTLMVDGNRSLGGDDFTKAIVELMMSEIRKSIGIDFSTQVKSGLNVNDYATALQKMYTEADKKKCALSTSESEEIKLVNLFPYKKGYYDLNMTVTREAFLQEASSLVREIENVIRRSFENIDFDEEDVDRVILVGGSSNMPFVRNCVKKIFEKEPYADKDLSKLVAKGAAILADDELGNGIQQHDIISHSFGTAVLDRSNKKLRLSKMLNQYEEYPCECTKTFYTAFDYQKSVKVEAYEGEDIENLDNNRYIGDFDLDIERAPAGKEIVVRFRFDKNCILHVMAKDPKYPDVEKEIELDPYYGSENESR